MTQRHSYRYLRAWARYVGLGESDRANLLAQAHKLGADPDVYSRSPEGRWLTIRDLETQAHRGAVAAQHLLRKIREYAGA